MRHQQPAPGVDRLHAGGCRRRSGATIRPEEVSDTELLSDAAIIKITLNGEFVMSSRIRISAKTGVAPLPIVIVVAVWMVSPGIVRIPGSN